MSEIVFLHQLSLRAQQQDAGAQMRRDPVVLLVPSCELSTLAVDVSQVPARYRQQALPALLEDRLLQEIDQLHLASGPSCEGQLPVLIVSDSQMQEWLDTAHVCGVEPVAIYPDFYTLKDPGAGAVVTIREGQGLVRFGTHQGSSGEVAQLMALVRHAELDLVALHSDGSVAVEPADLVPQPLEPVALYGEPINLRQGAYALKNNRRNAKGSWWPQLGLAALLLLAVGLNLFMQNRYYQSENARISQSVTQNYQRLFGTRAQGSDWMDEAKYQRSLIDLAGAPSRQRAWQLLKRFNRELQRCASCEVEAVTLSGNRLELTLQEPGSEPLIERLAADPRWQLEQPRRHRGQLFVSLSLGGRP